MGILFRSSSLGVILSTLVNYTLGYGRELFPWIPLRLPPTTAQNDGSSSCRYSGQETLAYLSDNLDTPNCHYSIHFITTKDGKKHHLTTNACMVGKALMNTFTVYSDLNTNKQVRGFVSLDNATAQSEDHLFLTSTAQNVSTPSNGDKWTPMHWQSEQDNVVLDAELRPTGGNHYHQGSGGILLSPIASTPEIDTMASFPGYSWYWSNSHMRISGNLTIDGVTCEIDPNNSFSHYERQYGYFGVGAGYWALWLWFETGEYLETWINNPSYGNETGRGNTTFVSVWHPNGLHEAVPVGPNTRASDIYTSSKTNKQYFNKFILDLPAIHSSLNIEKWDRFSEIPVVNSGAPISESYTQGTTLWKGKMVKFVGHIEQIDLLH